MKNPTRTAEDNQKAQLENEIVRLNKKIAKYEAIELKQNRFGLVWLDVPEAFEDDVENKLPILEEVPKLAITGKNKKLTHLLIEGDNYHALTCLNYTHKGKVDVIYIDPPYNTGLDGFKYKDKRILEKFPDGTEVPVDHPLRHSYWLSFMRKRLELARDILRETGAIFISIDDNEFAQLKLLCDEIFTEKNFVAAIVWQKVYSPKNQSKRISNDHEYVFAYAKNIDLLDFNLLPRTEKMNERYKNLDSDPRGQWKPGDLIANEERKNGHYIITGPHGDKFNSPAGKHWAYNQEKMLQLQKDNRLYFGKTGKSFPSLKQFLTEVQQGRKASTIFFYNEAGHTDEAKKELKMFFKQSDDLFSTPKPTRLIKQLLRLSLNKNSLVMDFFAGSGTTGQAVMELNDEDKGNRQFILITNNDEITNGKNHKIMTDICYPRIKKVIKGYDSKKGLNNSVKYFKTSFIGKHNILKADDADKIELAHNVGGMLAIAENTFEQIEQNDYWQIFENEKQYLAVYFREEFNRFDNFVEKVKELKKPVVVYIFSWERELEFNDFGDDKNIKVKTIPQPILEIYKQIYNLV